jgi:hypothetical protein
VDYNSTMRNCLDIFKLEEILEHVHLLRLDIYEIIVVVVVVVGCLSASLIKTSLKGHIFKDVT